MSEERVSTNGVLSNKNWIIITTTTTTTTTIIIINHHHHHHHLTFSHYSACYILNPAIYNKNRYCLIGPHYPFTIFIVLLAAGATYLFGFQKASLLTWGRFHQVICVLFWMAVMLTLAATALKDPGIVDGPKELPAAVLADPDAVSEYRYCTKCDIYQAKNVSHCSICKVCIEDLHHHCPWMGKCIGKDNMRAFKWFNVSWIAFFMYLIIRVMFLG